MAATDFDYRAGRARINRRALSMVGALALEDPISAEQEAQCSVALMGVLRNWENRRVFLWKLQQVTITTVAGTPSYTISTDPAVIDIEQAAIVDSNNFDDPISVKSWRDYNRFVLDKAAPGRPTVLAVRRTTGDPLAYLHPVPDAVYSIRTLAVCRLKDYDTSGSTPDFPVNFEEALVYALADRLFDEYPGTQGQRDRIAAKAETEFVLAKGADRESTDDNTVSGAFSYGRNE
jgi:hypothetical protein